MQIYTQLMQNTLYLFLQHESKHSGPKTLTYVIILKKVYNIICAYKTIVPLSYHLS